MRKKACVGAVKLKEKYLKKERQVILLRERLWGLLASA
jgi:hypothetical protein